MTDWMRRGINCTQFRKRFNIFLQRVKKNNDAATRGSNCAMRLPLQGTGSTHLLKSCPKKVYVGFLT